MLTSFNRIFKFAIDDFSRNKGISLAAIFVLVVTIMLVSGLFFFRGISSFLISEIQDRIDITAYFKDGVEEQDILNVKDEILKMSPNIKGVEYISKERAMEIFNKKHRDNAVIVRAIEEVGTNFLLPSLNIKTNGDPAQYAGVSNVLQTANFSKFIDRVDFSQKKDTIEKVFSITSNINNFGIITGVMLVIVAMLVVFNTIKLAVDNSKEEISTMRIVGASDWFIRGPFIIQGAIYGLIACVVSLLISGASAYLLSSKIGVMMPGFNLFGYFLSNIWILVLIQLAFGAGVGIISSFIVVRKYLDV
ncbi:MAG: permease-like cell division protein FtsX [Patescibacteria group bacterium]